MVSFHPTDKLILTHMRKPLRRIRPCSAVLGFMTLLSYRGSASSQHDGAEDRAQDLSHHEAEHVEAHHRPEEERVDRVQRITVPQHCQAVHCVLLAAPCRVFATWV